MAPKRLKLDYREDIDLSDNGVRKNDPYYRSNKIKEMMLHCWDGYEKYAFGHDELNPKTNTPDDPFGGTGLTLIDSVYVM